MSMRKKDIKVVDLTGEEFPNIKLHLLYMEFLRK